MDARAGGEVEEGRRPGRFAAWGLVAVLLGTGCQNLRDENDGGPSTTHMVPRSWRGNPWGPQANAARQAGLLPVAPTHPDLVGWDHWGRTYLRDGDILFRKGNARAFFGILPFSRFVAAVSDSRFSHTAIVAIEDGQPVIYDTCGTGVQRQPFGTWMVDVRAAFAVKRSREPYRDHVPAAVAFCQNAYRNQVPFDKDLQHGDDRLYCVELTQRAYASSGLDLSRPIALNHMPRYQEFPKTIALIKFFTAIEPDQTAYVAGNDRIGLWSSPALETIYESPPLTPTLAGEPPPGETGETNRHRDGPR